MKSQITLDSEDIAVQLCNYLSFYANVLKPIEVKRIADCINVLINK